MSPAATETPPVLTKLGIPNGKADGKADDMSDSKVASPTDSENAEKNMAALEASMNGKLQIKTDTASARDPLVHDAVGTSNAGGPNFDSDPLSATALVSPLHSINWDAVQGGSLNALVSTGSSKFSTSASKWENFKRLGGPRYPPSLEKLVMDYHHKHSKSWQLAHDMGSGSGVYAPTMARYFRHVHVSDPAPSGLATSRQALSAWAAENKKSRGRFTFSSGKAEQGHESVADGTVDLAIMMEGAHFTTPEAMVRSAAQTLAQHGTLALVSYSPICHVNGNPAANAAVQKLFTAWGQQPWDVVGGDSRSKKQFSLGLDFVPLPEDLFDQTKTRRIMINYGKNAFAVPGVTPDASDSRVRNGERHHDYTSENSDDQAKGWRQDVGPEFFRSMTAALVGAGQVQQFEEHFNEIGKIVHATSLDGITITVEWTVAIVLATRR